MSLISKSILIEGEDGRVIEKQYYVKEKVVNPYEEAAEKWGKDTSLAGNSLKGSRLERRNMKVREFGSRKKRPDELPYTWTMGYNNCVGRYAPPGKRSRFSGSSLNRSKQIKLFPDGKDVSTKTGDLLKLAYKVAKKMLGSGRDIPGEVSDFLMRRDKQSELEFERWLSDREGGDEDGLSFAIHMLSPRSRGKIKDKATAFFRACPGSRIFCTLTFIAAVDDRTGVAILNKFLTALRKEFGKIQFLWVAERQTNNEKYPSNIHFHIILNKRLPVRQWNALWVLQQYNAGLVGEDKYGQEVTLQQIREAFKRDTVHKIFNPLDVKPVRSIGGLSMYLTKYITKQEKNQPFGCSVWHCSRSVSRMFIRATVGPSAFAYMKSFANFRVDKGTGECWPALEVKKPFFVMVYAHDKAAPLKYLREMEQINKWILAGSEPDKVPEIDDDIYKKLFCKN